MNDREARLQQKFDALAGEKSLRELKPFDIRGLRVHYQGRELINFSSNDYLGLSTEPSVIEASIQAVREWGTGGLSSRLVSGHSLLCEQVETEMAAFKQSEACLIFPNGYSANLGILQSFVTSQSVCLVDRLCHASLIDAVRSSGAKFLRFRHNDMDHLEKLLKEEEKKNASAELFILTESVFSMEGDLAPLKECAALAKRYKAYLYVDEAHATGVFGRYGEGLSVGAGLGKSGDFPAGNALVMGTFGKALGNFGAYFSGTERQKKWLINKSRPFIYTTALPPAVIGGIGGALAYLKSHPGIGASLLEKSRQFRKRLLEEGMELIPSESQILSILTGDNETTLALSNHLLSKGFMAVAIRPPTVEPGRGRVRLSICQGHNQEDLEGLLKALKDFRRI